MRKMDHDGLLLCRLQGAIFEASVEEVECNSYMFIRRFMFSSYTKMEFDSAHVLDDNQTEYSIIEEIEKEYKKSSYGQTKYGREEMFWMGYIYRYMAYINQISSEQCFRIIKPNELRALYLPYHTLDCENAINRILEEKGYDFTPEGLNRRAMEIYREIFKERRERENKEKITIISNKLS